MSLNAILNNAYSGLAASQANLRVISNNVANVNTVNYSRETVSQEALVAGGQGNGVVVSSVDRVADKFLEKAVYSASADTARYTIESQFHDRLQGLLGNPDSSSSLSARLDSIYASINDLALDTSDVVRKSAVISDIERLTDEITRLSSDVQQLRADASNQLVDTVSNTNKALERVHDLNAQIVRAQRSGGDTAGLEQQRAQALADVSENLDITVIEKADGSVEVGTTSGLTLVDSRLRQLSYQSPGSAGPETNFPQIQVTTIDGNGKAIGSSEPLDPAIQSGKLRGLLDVRDKTLPDVANSLGEFAKAFAQSMNEIHSQYSAAPPPNALEGDNTGLLGTDRHGFSGKTTFAVTDSAGALVSKTTIDFDALPANATIDDVVAQINAGLGGTGTASFSEGVFKISATDQTNGVVVSDDSANPSSRGGQSFAMTFGLNQLITSAAPTNTDTGLTGTDAHGFTPGGTMSFQIRDDNNRTLMSTDITLTGGTMDDLVSQLNDPGGLGAYMTFTLDANGAIVQTPKPGFEDISLRVVSDTTSRGDTGMTVSDMFGLDHSRQASAAVEMKVNSNIIADPSKLALAKFEDSAAVGETAVGKGDTRGATALAEVESQSMSFDAAGNLSAVDAKLTSYLGFLLGDIAVQADSAATSKDDSSVLYDNVVKRRDDFGGVNMDEELANMVIFQNSYNACARVMTAAREMYDELLSILR